MATSCPKGRVEREPAGEPLRQQAGRGAARRRERHKMPSQGFYVRHVKDIQFDNIEIASQQEDLRPAFVLDDVQDADFFRIKAPHAADQPVFALHDVSDLSIHMCAGVKDTQLPKVDQKTL